MVLFNIQEGTQKTKIEEEINNHYYKTLTLKAARFLITPLLAILEKFFSVSKLKKMMIIPKN